MECKSSGLHKIKGPRWLPPHPSLKTPATFPAFFYFYFFEGVESGGETWQTQLQICCRHSDMGWAVLFSHQNLGSAEVINILSFPPLLPHACVVLQEGLVSSRNFDFNGWEDHQFPASFASLPRAPYSSSASSFYKEVLIKQRLWVFKNKADKYGKHRSAFNHGVSPNPGRFSAALTSFLSH